MSRVRALWALLRLAWLLRSRLRQLRVSFQAEVLHPETGDRLEAMVNVKTNRLEVERGPEQWASLLHEFYHLAQDITGQVMPIRYPVLLTETQRKAVTQTVRKAYPRDRWEREYHAEAWARAVLLALTGR